MKNLFFSIKTSTIKILQEILGVLLVKGFRSPIHDRADFTNSMLIDVIPYLLLHKNLSPDFCAFCYY